jgi:hypothetical protein
MTDETRCPDDGLWCNGDETCNESQDTCLHSDTSQTRCPDDGAYCNGSESCSEGLDACQSTGSPCANDGLYCNGFEFCDEGNDVCDTTGEPCTDDGVFCNGEIQCNEFTQDCEPINYPTCDDAVACTSDYCDPATDACVNRVETCYAIVEPICPETLPEEAFDVPIVLSYAEGETKVGFTVLFDSTQIAFVEFSADGAVFDNSQIDCLPDEIEGGKILCTATRENSSEPIDDAVLVTLKFERTAGNTEEIFNAVSSLHFRQTNTEAETVFFEFAKIELVDLLDDLQFYENGKCSMTVSTSEEDAGSNLDDDDDSIGHDDDDTGGHSDDDYGYDDDDFIPISTTEVKSGANSLEDVCACG